MTKGLLLAMLFLTQTVAASAQTRLYMEDFAIALEETKEVALLLDNDRAATAFQATIELPSGLTYVPESVAKTSRVKGRGAEVYASTETGKLVILMVGGTVAAGEGEVVTFQLTRTSAFDGDIVLPVSEIFVSDADANQLNTEESQNVSVRFLGLGDCAFAAPESFNIAVGQEYQVDVTLANEGINNLSAFQGKLALPAGLEIVEGEDGKFIYSDRLPAPLEFRFQDHEGYTSFILSSSNNTLIQGNEGVAFSFKVKASESLAENTVIGLSDLRVAATTGQSALLADVSISVLNTSVSDKAQFEAYQAEQAAAVEAMAAEGDSEASQQIIANGKAAVEAPAFDYAKTLDEQKAAIDAIVEQVAADLEAQRQQDAEAAAKEAADTKLAELKESAAALVISEDGKVCENEDVQAAVTAAEEAVAAANTAIAGVEAVITEGKLATDNKEALAEAVAAAEQAIADAQAAVAAAAEAYNDYVTGIIDVRSTEKGEVAVKYYDMNGKVINAPRKGQVVIVKTKDGKSVKKVIE